MKAYRWVYYGALVLFFFLGRLTGAREFFLLFLVMALVALFALGLVVWTIGSFSYTQELSSPTAVKGQELELQIGIYNDKPFPFTRMEAEVAVVSPRERYLLPLSLPQQDQAGFRVPVYCPYRGIYHVGMTRLSVSDVFGLVELRFPLESLSYYRRRELKVYPAIPSLPHLPARAFDAGGEGGRRLRILEEGDNYADLRPYQKGDRAKRVHWKQSARRGELLVRRYEQPQEAAVLLVLDTRPFGQEGEGLRLYADLACECAAALGLYSLRAGHRVRLLDGGEKGGARGLECAAPGQFQQLYDRLAAVPFAGKGPGEQLRAAAGRPDGIRTAYILTKEPGSLLEQGMQGLAAAGCTVVCLLLGRQAGSEPPRLPGVIYKELEVGSDVARVLSE